MRALFSLLTFMSFAGCVLNWDEKDLTGLECKTGDACELSCAGTERCIVECSAGSDCAVACGDSQDCIVECDAGANCNVQCEQADACFLDCAVGASGRCEGSCLVESSGGADCT